ncbi:putative nucleotidyltransferase substrate binding domain-containing protein [uncultured Friedmanniella sp.]|uniref:putative nucleotidyltransferase substrate binding domain-containing protein n=1 Tax=uncultured Friedmanniella sp. TaxID=335381 RepID=UPI0035CA8930
MPEDLAALLAGYAPFDSLDPGSLRAVAGEARIEHLSSGELIYDAFTKATAEVFLVIAGRVELWNLADALNEPADQVLGPGGVFGFSAMLTERPVGPRAVATSEVTVARMPGAVVEPAFTSRRGARYLAEQMATASRQAAAGAPAFSTVDELILRQPVVVAPDVPAEEVARQMTAGSSGYAAVHQLDGSYGLITDALLRRHILAGTQPPTVAAGQVMDPTPPVIELGSSAAEALIMMLDADAEFLLVTDRAGQLRGVVAPRDFAVSPTTAGVALHEQLRRATTLDQLTMRTRRVPAMLADLLSRGLAADKVIAVHSAIRDTVIRRAIALVFADHPELSVDAFTWLSLGSNGRREAVPSSDVDSAVAFVDELSEAEADAYRTVFGEVEAVLTGAGLSSDAHGATAKRRLFARTNADWRRVAGQWLANPVENQGAIMTSLLVDGRPIHGDPGLPAAAAVFSDLRRHPGTMRLLLQESLSRRARMPPSRGLLTRRTGSFDVKDHALLPIVNLARWAALSVGSAALPTTERLQAAAGSAMLPQDQALTLVEVFEVLQRLRLRYQIRQHQRGETPTDLVQLDQVSPIDRSVLAQAVREVSAVQRRMDNVSQYVPAEGWALPDADASSHQP